MADETPATDPEYTAPATARAGAKPPRRKITLNVTWLVTVIAAILLCVASFYAGTAYEKNHNKSTATSGKFVSGQGGFGGGFGGRRMNGSIGSVTTVSSSSITVNDQRSGSTKTYSITSSTQITDNGSAVPYSDIQTGDTVLVTAGSSSSTTAERILVNPSFGGPGGTQNNSQGNSGGSTEAQ
ncbi:MAG TPA: hypothetical protein VHB72_04030 [Candidatus Saccharimonadales bacterium]|nr:hypothetical protein [Candidatus Saccharimonadales bacterium]